MDQCDVEKPNDNFEIFSKPVIAKPSKIGEKMRHMERLESDDLLEGGRRYQGLSREKREEFRNIFKLTTANKGYQSVQVKINLGLLNGGTLAEEAKDQGKRKIFNPSADKKDANRI